MRFLAAFAVLALLAALPAASRAQFTPNDPYYALNQWDLMKIGLPDAWTVTTGSPSVKVAVLDTGVVRSTPDLSGRLIEPQLSATGSAPFSDSTLLANSALWHGTWVSSTLAMGVNNGVGGAGVGNFTVLPITVTNSNANNSSDWIGAGIQMAAANGAKVISISQSTLNYNTLNNAATSVSNQALVFVSAGNTDTRVNMPQLSNLIFVSGTDQNDARWTDGSGQNGHGSSWGPYVDLAAPAQSILCADPDPDFNGYTLRSGTSFAAPLAAGVAGLIWSVNPDLTPAQVRNILFDSAVDLGTPGWDEVYGYGRINAAAAVQEALLTVPEPASIVLAGIAAAGLVLLRRRVARK